MPQLIESPQNPRFKRWKSLLEGRGIRKHGKFLLSGRKAVPEALRRYSERFQAILYCDEAEVASWPLPPALQRYQVARSLFAELDVIGTKAPLLLGELPELPAANLAAPPQGMELVCALGNPDNLGALLRSAAAFGVSRVILLPEAAQPFHPRALRSGANAQFELELLQGPAWAKLAQAAGPMVALDAAGESLSRYSWPQDLRLVLGEEGQGLPPDLPLERLSIPTTGRVESLNATVAVSLALFSYFQAWRPRG